MAEGYARFWAPVIRPGAERVLDVAAPAFASGPRRRTDRAYGPDRVANDTLDAAGFDPPEPDTRPGEVASPTSAAQSMRRARLRDVAATTGEVAHPWDAAGYLAFLTEFDE